MSIRRVKILFFTFCFLLCGLVGCADGSEEPSQPMSSEDSSETTSAIPTETQTTVPDSSDPSDPSVTTTKPYTTTEGTTVPTTPSPKPAAPKTLANTYYKLTHDKNLKIVYCGGSIKGGHGSSGPNAHYSALTTNWLKSKFPTASIEYRESTRGGHGSTWGIFYLDVSLSDLISGPSFGEKADLYFLEYAINDNYDGLTGTQSSRNIESMIKKIYTQNPYADIVLLFTTDTSKNGGDFEQLTAIRRLAEYYGLPCINLGAQLAAEGNLSAYLIDTVHPNDAGYQKYASYITGFLEDNLVNGGLSASDLNQQEQPAAMLNSGCFGAKMVLADALYAGNEAESTYSPWDIKTGVGNIEKMKIYSHVTLTEGHVLTYTFSGTKVWILGDMSSAATSITAELDGKTSKKLDFGAFHSGKDGQYAVLFDGLSSGTHTLKITVSGKKGYIGALMIADENAY